MDKSEDKQFGRRNFMKAAIAGIGGLIGAAFGLPAIPYIMGPALQKESDNWIQLGSVSKVELNIPTLFKKTIETQTGWINTEEEISVYVLTSNGQDYFVMSNVCTHLGCRVRWIPENDGFFCPCHNGVFSKDGNVVDGPPPRPLDRFESKVEDGVIFIKRG
ncbi:MAG: ubiquinol-cytochrome c reductase iron-sulfur subunit [Anaerolineaceae bacterium]|nr:MAG: ubiquinol-cytochrome c reductase iron-sulfur subunit [Anaerolineaceae bacterium]